jgi:hypothetical protein
LEEAAPPFLEMGHLELFFREGTLHYAICKTNQYKANNSPPLSLRCNIDSSTSMRRSNTINGEIDAPISAIPL